MMTYPKVNGKADIESKNWPTEQRVHGVFSSNAGSKLTSEEVRLRCVERLRRLLRLGRETSAYARHDVLRQTIDLLRPISRMRRVHRVTYKGVILNEYEYEYEYVGLLWPIVILVETRAIAAR